MEERKREVYSLRIFSKEPMEAYSKKFDLREDSVLEVSDATEDIGKRCEIEMEEGQELYLMSRKDLPGMEEEYGIFSSAFEDDYKITAHGNGVKVKSLQGKSIESKCVDGMGLATKNYSQEEEVDVPPGEAVGISLGDAELTLPKEFDTLELSGTD